MGDRQDSKRPRQSSDSSGIICHNCEQPVDKTIECSGCKLTFCLRCGKINEALYQCIVDGEMSSFHWSCRSCTATFPSLANITATLYDIKGKYEYRMSNLEEKVGNLEQTTKQEVTTQVSKMKDEIIDSLKEDINTVVDTRNRKLEDRKRREMNITIFNLLEHDSDSGSENKRADELDVRTISANLGLKNLCITMSYRLGRKEDGKTRPLRVILDSKAQRKFLIENAKHIPKKTQENFQRVIIVKDLKPEQRRERREKIKYIKAKTTTKRTRTTSLSNGCKSSYPTHSPVHYARTRNRSNAF